MDPHRLRLAADVELCRGSPVPLGATVRPDGVNFAVASRYATSVTLLIFSPGEQNAMVEFPLDGRFHQALGVNAVELMPVWAFEEADSDRVNPFTGERLLNYWGYHPIPFFAPHAAYASRTGGGEPLREFKEMVKRFHGAGIAVILDVVLNHTAEGNERGPTQSFRGLDNTIYYLLDPDTGAYRDYTGCGNTLNCNHPRVRELIIDVLRYWVAEMHVDGFRFDLASILGRGEDGSVLANPPVIEQIAEDPGPAADGVDR